MDTRLNFKRVLVLMDGGGGDHHPYCLSQHERVELYTRGTTWDMFAGPTIPVYRGPRLRTDKHISSRDNPQLCSAVSVAPEHYTIARRRPLLVPVMKSLHGLSCPQNVLYVIWYMASSNGGGAIAVLFVCPLARKSLHSPNIKLRFETGLHYIPDGTSGRRGM